MLMTVVRRTERQSRGMMRRRSHLHRDLQSQMRRRLGDKIETNGDSHVVTISFPLQTATIVVISRLTSPWPCCLGHSITPPKVNFCSNIRPLKCLMERVDNSTHHCTPAIFLNTRNPNQRLPNIPNRTTKLWKVCAHYFYRHSSKRLQSPSRRAAPLMPRQGAWLPGKHSSATLKDNQTLRASAGT